MFYHELKTQTWVKKDNKPYVRKVCCQR